jgi:hypothetical protein
MKCKGDLLQHKIRRPKRPGIAGITKQEPRYEIHNSSKSVSVDFHLPLVTSANSIDIWIEEKSIVLHHALYQSQIFTKHRIDVDHGSCDAIFDKYKKILSVVLPKKL